jgi:hypothetical protein
VIGHLEHWSFVDSIYYATITSCTIGYGLVEEDGGDDDDRADDHDAA